VFRYGVHRSAAFWQWRYLDSIGFRYLFWGDASRDGVIIGRVERVLSPEAPEFDGMPVLRLIELLPATPAAWQSGRDERFVGLLRGALSWAAQQGCVLADYQNSSDRLAPALGEAGLREVRADEALARTPNMFVPLRFNAAPINYVWRLGGSLSDVAVPESNDIYFVKSDDGMDRPNVWPLPATHAWDEGELAESMRA
jgi:hypothetical protein